MSHLNHVFFYFKFSLPMLLLLFNNAPPYPTLYSSSSCYAMTATNNMMAQTHNKNTPIIKSHSRNDPDITPMTPIPTSSASHTSIDQLVLTRDGSVNEDGKIASVGTLVMLPNESYKATTPRLWPLPLHFTSGHSNTNHNSTNHTTTNHHPTHHSTTNQHTNHHTSTTIVSPHLQFYYTLNSIHDCIRLSSSTRSYLDNVNSHDPRSMSPSISTNTSSVNHNSTVLDEAFKRYSNLIFGNHRLTDGVKEAQVVEVISTLCIDLKSMDESLHLETDESYSLQVPHPNDSSLAYIQANTVFGALRALETFSQLCSFEFESKSINIHDVPWSISDKPRFRYRGLLVDTARHYQPLRTIKKVLDAMSYAKLNVLHWHIVDTQSFPLEIPSFPKLWDGAYSVHERYTMDDAKVIVEYAKKRGIHVLPEVDVPGHAASWGVGYPELWPSANCTQPLDVSRNFTFHIINGILSDFAKVFPFGLVHVGGDEVNTSCWTSTPRIRNWLRKNNLTTFDAYKNFVLEVEAISLSHGFTPVNWEEPFDRFGAQLNKKTIIHNWLQSGVAPKVVKAGLRCIVSNQDAWYLDHLNVSWLKFYMNEPLTNITDTYEQSLVIGGEVCMWGETVDPSDIEQTIWPRAAAAAERLWSSLDRIAKDPRDAMPRLCHFRCLLNERGISAAPVGGYGRSPPLGPGSCYFQ